MREKTVAESRIGSYFEGRLTLKATWLSNPPSPVLDINLTELPTAIPAGCGNKKENRWRKENRKKSRKTDDEAEIGQRQFNSDSVLRRCDVGDLDGTLEARLLIGGGLHPDGLS